jgi:hypothetical protein
MLKFYSYIYPNTGKHIKMKPKRKPKMRPIYTTLKDEDGNIIERIPLTEADDDWIRAGRLRQKALNGDKEAEEELRRMENAQMYEYTDDEEEADE